MKNKKSIWLVLFCLGNLLLIKQERRAWKCLSKKKNKRGWLLIMEAFVSMMLLLGLSIYFIQKQTPKADIGEEIAKQARYLIKEAAHNNDVRNAVMGNNICVIRNFVYQRLRQVAPYLDYHIKLCDPGMACRFWQSEKDSYKAKGIDIEKKEIYADDYLFSANLTVFKPTVMKIYLWMSERGPSMPFTLIGQGCCANNIDVCRTYQCNSQTTTEQETCPGITYNPSPPNCNLDYLNMTDMCYWCNRTYDGIACEPATAKCTRAVSGIEAEKRIYSEDATSCKNNIDNNCDTQIGCFGLFGTSLTGGTRKTDWESECKDRYILSCALGLCLCQEKEQGIEACTDGIDNDGDGYCDRLTGSCGVGVLGDEGCGCTDGLDNDNDGRVDGADEECQ